MQYLIHSYDKFLGLRLFIDIRILLQVVESKFLMISVRASKAETIGTLLLTVNTYALRG